MVTQSTLDSNRFRSAVAEAIEIETRYRDAAIRAYPLLLEYAATSSPAEPPRKENARDEANRILTLLPNINLNIATLTNVLAVWDSLPAVNADTPETTRRRQQIIEDYSRLQLHPQVTVDADILNWERIIREIEPAETDSEEEEQRADEAQETLDRIENNTRNNNNSSTSN